MKRTIIRALVVAFVAGATAQPLTACWEEKGPLEKAGEKADEAINDTKRAVKDAAD
jgi:hypothetical protein